MTVSGPLRWIAILFAACLLFEGRLSYDSIHDEIHINEQARLPFVVASPGASINALEREAKNAGLEKGDQNISIGGRPIRGLGPLAKEIRRHRPGDSIQVTVTRNGAPASATIRLTSDTIQRGQWLLIIFLNHLTPWFSIALGFSVLFLRPRDPLAWLLLGLLLSFSEIGQSDTYLHWDGWMQPVAFYHNLMNGSWGLFMMLFGQYFPNRQANRPWDRRLRWSLGVPILVGSISSAALASVVINDAAAFPGVQRVFQRLSVPLLVLSMMAISTFFINAAAKWRSAQSRDDKRRLKLLYSGATIAFTPLFVLVLVQLVLKKSFTGSEWVVYPALLLLFLFPLTLAYVIVVEKAMDLRVVIRTGLQYALARRGLVIVTAIVSVGALLIAFRIINNPGVRGPYKMMTLAFSVLIIIRVRKATEGLRHWIDRRFFREAVDTERVLSELGEQVRSIVEVTPLLATVTHTISSTLHVPRVAAILRENGAYKPAHALGFQSAPAVKFSAASAVAEQLQRAREPVRVSLSRPDSWVARDAEERKQLETLETELLLPLAVKDRLLGFLSLGPKLSEEPYSPTDVRLLQSVAVQTGLALENSRLTEMVASEVAQRERLNRELEIAREVQQRLFPQSGPKVEGLDYAGKCRPASSVGGDYYDFVSMCDGRLGIAIGDISGKGVPAALLMASLQASLRGLAISNPPALSTLMGNLNRLIYEASPSNRYATFFFGVYDPRSREFQYVNGGHNPPMIFRDTEVLRLEDGGPVVGLFGPAQYSQSSIRLERGDTLVLFTDGVSEAMNDADEEFDEARLIDAVRSGARMNANHLIDHIIGACDDFAAGAPQHDDMTLVVVRVEAK
jgi:sigma-B regulation protein RsbU (phosphoserine phosphatase)